MDDIDIFRAAAVLIKEHGEEAPDHADNKFEDMLERSNLEGAAVWLRIIKPRCSRPPPLAIPASLPWAEFDGAALVSGPVSRPGVGAYSSSTTISVGPLGALIAQPWPVRS